MNIQHHFKVPVDAKLIPAETLGLFQIFAVQIDWAFDYLGVSKYSLRSLYQAIHIVQRSMQFRTDMTLKWPQ